MEIVLYWTMICALVSGNLTESESMLTVHQGSLSVRGYSYLRVCVAYAHICMRRTLLYQAFFYVSSFPEIGRLPLFSCSGALRKRVWFTNDLNICCRLSGAGNDNAHFVYNWWFSVCTPRPSDIVTCLRLWSSSLLGMYLWFGIYWRAFNTNPCMRNETRSYLIVSLYQENCTNFTMESHPSVCPFHHPDRVQKRFIILRTFPHNIWVVWSLVQATRMTLISSSIGMKTVLMLTRTRAHAWYTL